MKKKLTEDTLTFVNGMGLAGFCFKCIEPGTGSLILSCIAEDRDDKWWGFVFYTMKSFGYDFCGVMSAPDENGELYCTVDEIFTDDETLARWEECFRPKA